MSPELLIPVEVHTPCPPRALPACRWGFPDASEAPPEGLVAVGGDFAPATVVAAYRGGIFPWPHATEEYLWFSPDPRAILPLDAFHVSRRLGRTIRKGDFRVTVDAAFEEVMRMCSIAHGETWITPALRAGYLELYHLGWAHSFETWRPDGTLAGGLYGVGVGALYGAESMFHAARDASKVAVAAMVQHASRLGVRLVDIQVLSPHTASLGGVDIPREAYLDAIRGLMSRPVDWTMGRGRPWRAP